MMRHSMCSNRFPVSRRRLLSGLSGIAVARAASRALSTVHLGCQTNAWRIDPKDFSTFLAVLKKIEQYRFEGFETGFINVQDQFANAAGVREQIAQSGLRFFGVHIFLLDYDPRTLIAPASLYRRVADGAALLGAERLILSGGSTSLPEKIDRAALARKAGAMNAAAAYARDRGLRFAYHNHSQEFAAAAVEIEALLRETDPALVDLLLDAGHAFEAKADVPAFFTRHHARIVGMHLRDFRGNEQVPLGSGEVDLRSLAKAIAGQAWKGWLLAEEERLQDVKPGDSAIAPARETFRRVFGV